LQQPAFWSSASHFCSEKTASIGIRVANNACFAQAQYETGMFTHNFGLIFVAIVAVVVGAVAIARPSAGANIGISSKTYPFAAKCPMNRLALSRRA
jgi:hypothetical protein